MKIIPFETEIFYSKYEFSTPYLLSVSDCETLSIGEVLDIAGIATAEFLRLELGYTESQGNQILRGLIAEQFERIEPDDVLVLGSPIEGIYLVYQALLEEGDEAVILSPAYDALLNVPIQEQVTVHRWMLQKTDTGWRLDMNALEQFINQHTKLIVVNLPHNPTGYLPTEAEFNKILDLASKYGIWIFCDEMYRGLEMADSYKLPSTADSYERSIILSGLSKTHGLPGLRAGWLVTQDSALMKELLNWKFYTSICPPAPTEWLAACALQASDEIVRRSKRIIHRNLALAEEFFQRWQELFYWRQPIAGSVSLAEIRVASATEYCHALARDAGVLLLPSSFMGYDDHHVRFGFGRKSFGKALDQYDSWLARYHSTRPLSNKKVQVD